MIPETCPLRERNQTRLAALSGNHGCTTNPRLAWSRIIRDLRQRPIPDLSGFLILGSTPADFAPTVRLEHTGCNVRVHEILGFFPITFGQDGRRLESRFARVIATVVMRLAAVKSTRLTTPAGAVCTIRSTFLLPDPTRGRPFAIQIADPVPWSKIEAAAGLLSPMSP